MNSKQRRQAQRKAKRQAEFLASLLIEVADDAEAKNWSLDDLIAYLRDQGRQLNDAIADC